jgi:UrcA family protein
MRGTYPAASPFLTVRPQRGNRAGFFATGGSSMRANIRLALLAGGFALAASSVLAQDYGPGGPENIIVTAPRPFTGSENTYLNGPVEKVSMTGSVTYADLDLRTFEGVSTLRQRVRDEAQNICGNLEAVYPVRQAPGTSCYRGAVESGLIQANEAIFNARHYYYRGTY